MPPRRSKTTKVREEAKTQEPTANPSRIPAELVGPSFITSLATGLLEGAPEKELAKQRAAADLWGRCADIAYAFEVEWPRIGWQLRCLRGRKKASPDAVRDAVEPIRDQNGRERLALLLRPTSIPATSDDVRRTRGELVEARIKGQGLEESYSAQLERFTEARRAVYEASQKHGQQLKVEISRRIGNRIQLKAEYAAKERSLAAAQRKLDKANPNHREAAKAELSRSRSDFEKCQESLGAEESIISDLKKRLAAATRKNWTLARGEQRKRLRRLKELKAERRKQSAEVDRLDTLYRDQAAGFSRADFLKFVVEKRAEHHPRKLAKAVAGLPEIACRESVAQCRNHDFPSEYHFNYRVFEVIDRAWSKRDRDNLPLGDLVQEEISRLPKTKVVNGKRVPNYLRQSLHEKRADLERAIKHCGAVTPCPHPGEMPYVVTAKFLENMSRQRTTLERVLCDRTEDESSV